jgi:hypothetical protein
MSPGAPTFLACPRPPSNSSPVQPHHDQGRAQRHRPGSRKAAGCACTAPRLDRPPGGPGGGAEGHSQPFRGDAELCLPGACRLRSFTVLGYNFVGGRGTTGSVPSMKRAIMGPTFRPETDALLDLLDKDRGQLLADELFQDGHGRSAFSASLATAGSPFGPSRRSLPMRPSMAQARR